MAGILKSKRSGGPKTEAGKSVASKNSLKTGIYSNVVVLPGEDEAEYQQLENQFIKDFAPQDIAELTMVRELAIVVWKKHRLERLSLSSSLKVLNQPIELVDYERYNLFFRESAKYWVDHSEILTDELIALQDKILDTSKLFVFRNLNANDMNSMKLKYPYLYENIMAQVELSNYFTDKTPSSEEIIAFKMQIGNNETTQFVLYAVKHALASAADILWAHANASKCHEAAKSIQAQRLLSVMEMEMPRRVNDDLSRIFFRTLSELRKHQQWRQAKNTVDVTPKATKIND